MYGRYYENYCYCIKCFKVFMTEFSNQYSFDILENLNLKLLDYFNCNNNIRIHSSLGYLNLAAYWKLAHEKY
ncbi:IS3 family transposase [Acetobacterium wieringae]|uniref:IS3 family transposase n=1 Tax=Acetobacterium wieringae TaxID=52694 RepID=UPI003B845372